MNTGGEGNCSHLLNTGAEHVTCRKNNYTRVKLFIWREESNWVDETPYAEMSFTNAVAWEHMFLHAPRM